MSDDQRTIATKRAENTPIVLDKEQNVAKAAELLAVSNGE